MAQVFGRPKMSRNKYGTTAGGSVYGGSFSGGTEIGGSTELETHYLWGQPFNGTQDVNGDLTTNGNISAEGNISAGGDITADGNIETKSDLSVNGDAEIFGNATIHGDTTTDTLHSTNIENTEGITTATLTASDTIKTKNLTVTGRATFFELLIEQISATNGSLMITPARGFKTDWVQHIGSYIYLFFRQNKDGVAVRQTWKKNDQLLHFDFNKAQTGTSTDVSNTYYWALVDAVSETPVTNLPFNPYTNIASLTSQENADGSPVYYHWIRLRNATGMYDGVLDPQPDDECVQCGYRGTDDPQRQSAMYIATVDSLDTGIKAPFIAQYRGINDFSLSTHRKSYFDAEGAKFYGDFEITGELEEKLQETVEHYMEQHPVAVPYIGENGNWWIDGKDTGVKAEGQDGEDGDTPYIGENGNWWIGNSDTGVKAQGEPGGKGDPGEKGDPGDPGQDGEDGEDGEDGLSFFINPNPAQFTTADNGKVNEHFVTVSITAKRGNTNATISSVTDGATVNCGFYQKSQLSFTGATSWIMIRDTDYMEVEGIKGTTYIAPTSGTARLSVVVEGVTYGLTIPVSVDVKKYLNDFSVTLKEFKSEYQEFETSTNGTLTAHTSSIEQNARDIALKVDEVDVFPNYYLNPIYLMDEYRTGTGTNAFGFNTGDAIDRSRFAMECSDSFVLRTSSTEYETLVSPFAADGGRIYRILKQAGTTSAVSLYATDLESGSTAFLNRRVKLKGGATYTISMWIAMPDEYGKVNMYSILNGYNVAEINFWNTENGKDVANRTFRKNLVVSDTNVASKNGYWKQYFITFKTPKDEDVVMGDYTAHYGSECWMSLEPLIAVKNHVRTSAIYFAGIKVEVGDKATPMSSTAKNLLATGIDIEHKKITLTADNIIAKNNSGQQTFGINANGSVTIGGFITPEIVTITRDNIFDFVDTDDSGTYWIDFMKCGNVVIIESLPDDFTRTNSLIVMLPYLDAGGYTESFKTMARRFINQKISIINKTSEQFAVTGVIYKKGTTAPTSQAIGQNQCFIATQRYYIKNGYETIDWEYEIGTCR